MSNVIRISGRLFFGLFLAAGLLFLALVTLAFLTDANHLKPHLQQALTQRGIHAQFAGDLKWSIYPTAGITTSNLSLYNAPDIREETRLASLEKLDLKINLLALFRKKHLEVTAIVFEEPDIRYIIDEQGNTNWQPVLDTFKKTDDVTAPASSSNSKTSFHIAELAIRDLRLYYIDRKINNELQLDSVSLRLIDVNLNHAPISLQSQGSVLFANYPEIDYQLSGTLTQTTDTNFTFSGWQLAITSGPQVSSNLAGSIEIQTTPDVRTSTAFKLEGINPRLWAGHFKLPLPETANPAALTQLSVEGQILSTANQLEFSGLQLLLDQTSIHGKSSIHFRDNLTPKIEARLKISQINLDEYLPPERPEGSSTDASDQLLDLDFLARQSMQLHFDIDQMQIYQQTAQNIKATLDIKDNILELDLNRAAIYRGNATAKITVDNTASNVKVTSAINVDNIDVLDAMTSLELYDQLKGLISTRIEADTQGRTPGELTRELTAKIQARANTLQFLAMNVEQRYCDALAQLEGKPKITGWPEHTTISPFEVELNYGSGTVNIARLYTLIQGTETVATGNFIPESGLFHIPLDLAFKDFTATQKECPLLNAKWRSQKIPLVCKGNINALATDICEPDYKRLGDKLEERFQKEKDKLEDKAETRAREIREDLKGEAQKAEDKAEQRAGESREEAKDKVDEEAKNLLKNLVGEDKAEELEDKFKDFLNRK